MVVLWNEKDSLTKCVKTFLWTTRLYLQAYKHYDYFSFAITLVGWSNMISQNLETRQNSFHLFVVTNTIINWIRYLNLKKAISYWYWQHRYWQEIASTSFLLHWQRGARSSFILWKQFMISLGDEPWNIKTRFELIKCLLCRMLFVLRRKWIGRSLALSNQLASTSLLFEP